MNIKIVKKNGIEYSDIVDFLEYLKNKNIEIVEDIKEADVLVSLGGDGTILSLTSLLLEKNIPVFAINYGNVGYMTKISKEEIISSFEKFLDGKYSIDYREFLEIELNNNIYYALNELSIVKYYINSQLINVEVYQEKKCINTYRADGIIVSTPTGSTAYSLSSGGPIIEPTLKAMCISPLASQSLSTRSLVVSPYKPLYIRAWGKNEYVGLNIDGHTHIKLKPEDIVKVKLSDKGIKLIYINDDNYFDVLKTKLYWT